MDKKQFLRDFLVKTVCWNCSSHCSLKYSPNNKLCPSLETDISQFLNGSSNKISSEPPSIGVLVSRENKDD